MFDGKPNNMYNDTLNAKAEFFFNKFKIMSVFYLLLILILIYNIYVVFLSLVLARSTFLYYVF